MRDLIAFLRGWSEISGILELAMSEEAEQDHGGHGILVLVTPGWNVSRYWPKELQIPSNQAINRGMKTKASYRLGAGIRFLSLFFCLPIVHYGEDNSTALPKIVKAGDGLYRFGDVLIDRGSKEMSFPGTSNQVSGLVEYGLVHDSGKIHESLFRTTASPRIIHASLLLLKLKPAEGFFENFWAEKPKKIDYSANLVRVTVSWELNGTKHEESLEQMSLNQKDDQPIEGNSFVFTGSRIIEGTFLAETGGSVLAVYGDEDAIINSADHDSDNDDVWYGNKAKMPPLECPVTIRFHLPRTKVSGKLNE